MKYLIILLLFHYTRKVESILIVKIINFQSSLTYTLLMFLGEFLGGLSVYLYNAYVLPKKKKDTPNMYAKIQLIQGEQRTFQTFNIFVQFKIFLLIFFASFFDFNEFLISWNLPVIAILSPTSDQRLRIVITIISSLLCTYALRLKTGKHHNFSLIGMSICSAIILIIELIYKSRENNFGKLILAYMLVFCELIFVSFIDVTEKFLVEYRYLNIYKVLSSEGFFGIILCIIYLLINKINPFEEMNNVYKELDIGKSLLMIIFLILYIFLSAGVNIYKITCNIIYSPMSKSLPAYLLNPIFIIYCFFWEKDFIVENKQNYFYFISNLVLSIIIDFFALVYNEFFILNCFELEEGTHYGISERALTNSFIDLDDISEE